MESSYVRGARSGKSSARARRHWSRSVVRCLAIPTLIAALIVVALTALPQASFAGTPGAGAGWGANTYGQCNVPAGNFVSLTGGFFFGLGLKTDGSIQGWGDNFAGQLNIPSPNTGFVAVSAGAGNQAVGLKSDGTVRVWGANGYGQGNTPSPNSNFVAISAGGIHNLALKTDGSIAAWGDNGDGQCNVPAPNSGFSAVAAGQYHSLGLKSDGSVLAWGNNTRGQCTVPASATSGVVAISAGGWHSLALKSDGSMVVWGDNSSGQCDLPSPNTDFVSISAGQVHSVAVKSDGTIVCFGGNGWGQGNIQPPNSNITQAVAAWGYFTLVLRSNDHARAWGYNGQGQLNVPDPNSAFTAMSGGGYHSLGLKSDGSIAAWGYNDDGELNVPAPNSGFAAVAGGGRFSLGLKSDGSIVGWGGNTLGQLNVPAPNSGFVATSAGWAHGLGLKADGTIAAWGYNNFGQCNVPAPNSGFVAIAAGEYHSLGLKSDGSVVAWGWNGQGQCNVPSPNSDFIAVAGGESHSMGLRSDGSIAVWGTGSYGVQNIPAPNSGFSAIAAGAYHCVALRSDGTVAAWGDTTFNQTTVPTPNTGYASIAGGQLHSLAIQAPTIPSVSTTAPTTVTQTTADPGGNVSYDGGDSVTERGVCYGTSPNPDTAGTHVADTGGGTGSFTVSLSSLTPGQQYHIRAYATNSLGTAYGDDQTFTTLLYGVSVTPPSQSKSWAPGTSVDYQLTVQNTGNVSDTFNCDVSGNVWTTVSDTPSVTLASGASANVKVTVTIPPGAAAGAHDTASVRYLSTGDESKSATGTVTTTVNPAPAITYIHPDSGINNGTTHITDLRGSNFMLGNLISPHLGVPQVPPLVQLKMAGQSDITATNVQLFVVPGSYGTAGPGLYNKITCDMDLVGAKPGAWDVFVQNVDGQSATLHGGFTVIPPTPVVSSVDPPTGQVGQTVTVSGSCFGPTQGGSTITIGGVEATVVSWSDTRIVVVVPEGASSGAVVVTTSAGGSNTDKKFTMVNPTWYLAEGTNAWGFSTYITIENPNNKTVHAKLTYMIPGAGAQGKGRVLPPVTITLPPLSQTTVSSANSVGSTDFSSKVECVEGQTIAVDRTMFWDGTGYTRAQSGYHSSIGATSTSKTWYLPEGSSNWGFETWTLVENPNAGAAEVTLTYMTQDAGAKVVKKSIPAYSRATYSMRSDIGAADSSVRVTSNVPVVAEESMYKDNRREGSCSVGAVAPANDYFLAEGACGYDVGFITYVLVQNPGTANNNVSLTYQTQRGEVKGPSFTMPANSRRTVRVNDQLPANTDVSVQVHGSAPLIAEHSMYWDNGTGTASAASIGLPGAHQSFYLPDGQTAGGFETWTLVANPNPGSVHIRVTYLPQGGGKTVTFEDEIAPGSRKSYSMGDKIASGRAAIEVQSLDGARPIMVERSMYVNKRGAGTMTVGGFED
jgi:alpha-tubulin suppressor-like RCC1 family protein